MSQHRQHEHHLHQTASDINVARNVLLSDMTVLLQSIVGCCNNVQGSSKVCKGKFAAAVTTHVSIITKGTLLVKHVTCVHRMMPLAALSGMSAPQCLNIQLSTNEKKSLHREAF